MAQSSSLPEKCRKLVESDAFEGWIVTLILLNALCLGAETVPELSEQYDTFIWSILWGSQLVFTLEIAIRLISFQMKLKDFFRDFWNTFDFLIVAASYLPAVGSFATVARVLRVLRVLRILSVSDELRIFLDQMLRSVRLFIFAGIIWIIFAYVYAISGFYLFGEIDSQRWGSLVECCLTVFSLSLFQDINSVIAPLWAYSPATILYFVAFYAGLLLLLINIIAQVSSYVREGSSGD